MNMATRQHAVRAEKGPFLNANGKGAIPSRAHHSASKGDRNNKRAGPGPRDETRPQGPSRAKRGQSAERNHGKLNADPEVQDFRLKFQTFAPEVHDTKQMSMTSNYYPVAGNSASKGNKSNPKGRTGAKGRDQTSRANRGQSTEWNQGAEMPTLKFRTFA